LDLTAFGGPVDRVALEGQGNVLDPLTLNLDFRSGNVSGTLLSASKIFCAPLYFIRFKLFFSISQTAWRPAPARDHILQIQELLAQRSANKTLAFWRRPGVLDIVPAINSKIPRLYRLQPESSATSVGSFFLQLAAGNMTGQIEARMLSPTTTRFLEASHRAPPS